MNDTNWARQKYEASPVAGEQGWCQHPREGQAGRQAGRQVGRQAGRQDGGRRGRSIDGPVLISLRRIQLHVSYHIPSGDA